MRRSTIAGWAFGVLLAGLFLAVGHFVLDRDVRPPSTDSSVTVPSTAPPTEENQQGFLYGRVATVDGAAYEGRLRFAGDEEAFWDDTFNGEKNGNPWVADVPPDLLPKQSRSIWILGLKIDQRERPIDLARPFAARFGDIARIDARDRDVRVTLKSGATFDLDRFSAGDLDDGVRVWDARRGVVDLDSRRVRSIEFLPTPRLATVPYRLHGTVRTRQGDFTGFVAWNRDACVGTDELRGRTAEGELRLRFDSIRSIERQSRRGAVVVLLDGRETVLFGNREVGRGNRGIYVDDRRYGRVRISWDAFERVDFSPDGSGPAYGDFPPGRPLSGSVTTRTGDRLTGRLVYDLDESETTDTLDARSGGVDYAIAFGSIASIVHAGVTLGDGETLQLEPWGDLGERNAGLLVFVEGGPHPDYVPWTEVERIDFDRP